MTQRQKDDIIMNILSNIHAPISRAAVMIMLEDGTTTEERPFSEYVCAKNLSDALDHPEVAEILLRRNLDTATADRLAAEYERCAGEGKRPV